MMAEDYDNRWEALAEIHFGDGDTFTDEKYIYCLCSRVFIRDGVKLYYAEKEEGSESENENNINTKFNDLEDHSHVHFSVDTSYKVKCEKDESASCYCSASHTDNYCSTDEHDAAQNNALQPSDSGADLTYQESHLDYTSNEKPVLMEQDLPSYDPEINENYSTEDTWDKFWAINGERLIWASWIKKYSDYINPTYLDENNDLVMDENKVPKETDQVFENKVNEDNVNAHDDIRERKFSYDSKVNPYKKGAVTNRMKGETTNQSDNKDDAWLPAGRRRSFSEHDRMLSPRTLAGTDSMTNVTKITLSSYDVTSSHAASDSTPTDDYSVSSSTSDENNDQTRIANIDENSEMTMDDIDTDQYWQLLWKKHFGEQYAMHYANYIETQTPNVEPEKSNKIEVDFEQSENNSQELPTIVEVQKQVDKIKLDEKSKTKKRNKKSNNKYLGSVGVLLQTLLKEDQIMTEEIVDAGDKNVDNNQQSNDTVDNSNMEGVVESVQQTDNVMYNNVNKDVIGEDDEPPEEYDRQLPFKRSHELDEEELAAQKIKYTFDMMGLCIHPDAKILGQLVYRKRYVKPPQSRNKRFNMGKKIYFDEDGNPYEAEQSQDKEKEMQTDEECQNVTSDCERDMSIDKQQLERDKEEVLPELESSLSDVQEGCDNLTNEQDDEGVLDTTADSPTPPARRRRRKRRHVDVAIMPPELAEHPTMRKYWKKRHSLFNRFDEGIRLDLESWFSVTPERVATHLARRCRGDLVLDAFCGAAGNAIQLAFTCCRVIAIDIDPVKLSLARHNAEVYGVADRIEFILGDFFTLAPTLKADVVFLSPPWGGPNYSQNSQYDLETMLEPKPASELMEAALKVSENIALYVPRNTRTEQLVALAKSSGAVEIEQNFLGRRLVALTAYYGELVNY